MGITELEVIAFMVSGAMLVAHFWPESTPNRASPPGDLLGLLLLLLGLFLFIFGLLDVFIDHQK